VSSERRVIVRASVQRVANHEDRPFIRRYPEGLRQNVKRINLQDSFNVVADTFGL
jgi:hypothetical protein